MANFPDKVRIPTAISDTSRFDLSGDTITTSDIFKVKPSFIMECVPHDKVSINVETLIRSYPIAVPTYGRYVHQNRFFWVPMRTLMRGWNEFIEGSPYQGDGTGSVIINRVPSFLNSDVVAMFLRSLIPNTPLTGLFCKYINTPDSADAIIMFSDDGSYEGRVEYALRDYEDISSNTIPNSIPVEDFNAYCNEVPVVFTQSGRAFIDLLQNVGININWSMYDQRRISALPMLAYLRVFADYYCSPQFISGIQHFFTLTNGNPFDDIDRWEEILHEIVPGFSCYNPDYFVSAWNNPAGPNQNLSGQVPYSVDISTSDTGLRSSVEADSGGNPALYNALGQNQGVNLLTQYILNRLRSTANYAYRNNIAGYKFWDRLKAEYGAVLDYKEKGTSLYIDTVSTPIQISEVISTADTDNAVLGDLAGKGFGYSRQDHVVSFDSEEEFGYIICISSIVPITDYVQGTVREATHISRMDFYHADFDQQGTQAIEVPELYSSAFVGRQLFEANDGSLDWKSNFSIGRNFAFSPVYSEYKRGTSRLSGDFRLNSRSSGGATNAYHAFRLVAQEFDNDANYSNDQGEGLRHDLNFVQGNNAQFDRIFANSDPDFDHFQLFHHFQVIATRKMKSLADSIFDDEALRHNEKTEVQNGGSMFN